jgi:subtilisin family serine protease
MRKWVAGAVVVGLVLTTTPAQAAVTGPVPEAVPGSTYKVTLVTGDVLHVEREPSGRTRATVEPTTGGSGAFRVYEKAGHTHVVPLKAQPYLDSGVLDPRLFDVTGLVEQRYDDSSTTQLPLIVEYGAKQQPTPDGARLRASLPAVNSRAVSAEKSRTRELWADITGGSATLKARTLDDGIRRVWLDGKVKASLDRSVPYIGTTQAWQQGYDGTGVKVAVLDTGIDAEHPDLAGKLAGQRSFTPDGTTTDRIGHGTHVASTVAGAGSTYKGVAPGAQLMVGKVLADDGFGQESWIVAGMEWAAASGAKVVNLSLGSVPTDGTDPMSQAVNRLSASTGTLFVIAAGNAGPSLRTVSAPATADEALAVGNIQLDGTMNWSSSRGARVVDNAIKPEISAPGTGIVAAYPGGGHRAMTGTSMASPHVAGAAAILAQRHPDWTGRQLKAALVSTAVPLDGASVWDTGTGRVAVDRAVAQTVRVSDPVLDLGYLDLDNTDLVRERTVTYRNDGTTPVTLDLQVSATDDEGTAAPAQALTMTPSQVTIEPGQAQSATVRLDARNLTGQFGGRLTATGGPSPVSTAIGFYRQGDMMDVTLSITDRLGRPAGGRVTLLNYEKGVFEPWGYIETGVAAGQAKTLRIPRATYSMTAVVTTLDASGRFGSEVSMVTDPQRTLDRDTRVTFDARTARPVDVNTPRTSAAESLVLGWTRGRADGNVFVDSLLVLPAAGEVERVSASPTPKVTDGRFDVYTTWHRAVPWLTATIRGERFLPTYLVGSPRYSGQRRLPIVDAGTSAAGRDVRGKAVLLREDPASTPADQARTAEGAALVLLTPAVPGLLRAPGFGLPVPAATISYEDGQRLRARLGHGASLDVSGVPDPPYSYDLTFHDSGRVPPSMVRTVKERDLAQIDARYHGDGTDRMTLISRFPTQPCQCSLVRIFEQRKLPYRRTEYVSTGGSVWSAALQGGLTSNLRTSGLSYQSRRYTEDWGRGPLAPRPGAGEASSRTGDTLRLRTSPIADNGRHSGSSAGPSEGVLYRDGVKVADLFGGFGDLTVPAQDAAYRLEVDTSNGTAEAGRLSTATSSVWTFRSGHTEAARTLPLLSPSYDIPVSITNAVDPRRAVPVVIRASVPGATVRLDQARLSVSYDEGVTWRQVPVLRLPHGTLAGVLPPAGSRAPGGYAALRLQLTDSDGNTLDQTVHRAYRLADS